MKERNYHYKALAYSNKTLEETQIGSTIKANRGNEVQLSLFVVEARSFSGLNEHTFQIKVMLHNTESCQGRISVSWICVV